VKTSKELNQLLDIEDIFDSNRNLDSSLAILLTNIYQKSTSLDLSKNIERSFYWDDQIYNLNQTNLFKKLEQADKIKIYHNLSQFILAEGLYIEQLGFTFNSKMMLLSDSIEQKQLYASYAYDEALHFRMIEKFADRPDNLHHANPFLQFLADIVMNGERENLVFFIQIMLEGIGLEHYSELEKFCIHPELKGCLHQIVKDEAFHHGGGKILFNRELLDKNDEEFLIERSHAMLIFFQLTHMPLMFAITQAIGPLGEKDAIEFFSQINLQERTRKKMQFLKSQYTHCKLDNVKLYCEQNKLFEPNDLEQIWEIYKESVKV